jgi:hypothetical protein
VFVFNEELLDCVLFEDAFGTGVAILNTGSLAWSFLLVFIVQAYLILSSFGSSNDSLNIRQLSVINFLGKSVVHF